MRLSLSRLRSLRGTSLLVPLVLLCACAEEVVSPSIPDDVETDWIVDIRDGKRYRTVVIGDQTWMAENLNYVTSSGSFCYDGDSDNCDKYGRLYVWSAIMETSGKSCAAGSICFPRIEERGVCPQGFHLPSRQEWRELFGFAKSNSTCLQEDRCEDNVATAKALADKKTFSLGENTLGFTAKPAGYRYGYNEQPFDNIDEETYFWSSLERDFDDAYVTHFWSYSENYINAGMSYADKRNAYSVRCVKNSLPEKICSEDSLYCSVLDRANATLVDLRDSMRYAVTEIDGVVWLAENARFAVDDSSACFDGDSANCKPYGRLYSFESAQEACPGGTRLSTADDWKHIMDVIGMYRSGVEGSILKSNTVDWDAFGNGHGYGGYGLHFRPGGYRNDSGKYKEMSSTALFWTSAADADSVEMYKFENTSGGYERLKSVENIWASVRCVVE